jgi:hypothetical protein
MQSHFVNKWETLLYNMHKKRKQLVFCLNIFKSYITICDIMFFVDKKLG